MSDFSRKKHVSRRDFLAMGAAPAAALLAQGCTVLQQSAGVPSDGFLAQRSPENNHPLARLSFPPEARVSRGMVINRLQTPAHTVEGFQAWHLKGSHPYPFLGDSRRALLAEAIPVNFDESDALKAPPAGIRSGVPLGGYGTGTLELRADGSLADWQIFNNSPAGGGPKINLEEAFFGLRVAPLEGEGQSWTIRTHAPEELPSIDQLAYAGAFPVSRLSLIDPALQLHVSLYAYSDFHLHDAAQAATPAAIFTFILTNPTTEALETSVMFNVPNHIEGTFRTERGFVLSRSGTDPASGEISLTFASTLDFSTVVSPSLTDIWETFEKRGDFTGMPGLGNFEHGAVSTRFIIEAGATRTVSLILAWRFPHRPFAGAIVGNAYANRYSSASEAGAEISSKLPQIWRSLQIWDRLCTENTLPPALQGGLRNSLAQLYKTTFCTAGGRWRSWDSFATPHLSSLRYEPFRALPMMNFHPAGLQSHLRAYASRQHADGRISPSLGQGDRFPLDHSVTATDVAAIPRYILTAFFYFRSTGDEAFLKELWPNLAKAVTWQLSTTTPEGLPSNLPNLGDWASYGDEGFVFSDALLHVGALEAVSRMSEAVDAPQIMGELAPIVETGARAIEGYFWTGTHFRARWSEFAPASDDADDDSMLSLLWLRLCGLDAIVGAERLSQHLNSIEDLQQPIVHPDKANRSRQIFRPATALAWAALRILTGSPTAGISAAEATLSYLEDTLKDAWAHHQEINLDNDLPWSNQHHVSHLANWFVLTALTGQQYDAGAQTLLLSPRIDRRMQLPFFTPGAHGFLAVLRDGRYQIEVLSGRLQLKELRIGESIRYRDVYLETGESLELRA